MSVCCSKVNLNDLEGNLAALTKKDLFTVRSIRSISAADLTSQDVAL